ncbi:MAG: DNRLRE domain-containing protein [Candidatus Omnitrophica bacterium]|nr:DNRLRE domain-containing protein [Candidatus Omnitrophota bacterium]
MNKSHRSIKKQGFVLVSIIVLIVLSTIVLSTSMYLLNEVVSAERGQLSWQRLRGVEARLIGHRYLCHNDAGSNTGNFSEATTFPGTTEINALMADVDAFKRSDGSSLAEEDAYGTISLASGGGNYTITSLGRDKLAAGTGDDADRSISITEAYRTGCDIAVRIVDASVSGNATVTGNTDDYFVNTTTFGVLDPQWGHTILDDTDLTVCLYHPPVFDPSIAQTDLIYQTQAMTDAGGGPTKYFTADNVPYGYHRLQITPLTPWNTNRFDPYWQGEEGGALHNVLSTYIFVSPTSERQKFNIVYPVIAPAYGLRETGDTTAEVHQDKMVDFPGNDYNYLDPYDPESPVGGGDPYEYLIVGRADLGSGVTSCRALLKFDLTGAGKPPGLTSSSKVVFAELILFNDTDHIAGSDTVEVHRFTGGNWNESSTNHAWTDVDDDYSDKQGEQYFASSPPAYLSFDVTVAVQKWVIGDWSNYGFLVRITDESASVDDYYAFKSQESNPDPDNNPLTPDVRPRLVIAYYK